MVEIDAWKPRLWSRRGHDRHHLGGCAPYGMNPTDPLLGHSNEDKKVGLRSRPYIYAAQVLFRYSQAPGAGFAHAGKNVKGKKPSI